MLSTTGTWERQTDYQLYQGSPPAFDVDLSSAKHTHINVSFRYTMTAGPRWYSNPGDPTITVSAGTLLHSFRLDYDPYPGYVPGGWGFNPMFIPVGADVWNITGLTTQTDVRSVTLPYDGSAVSVVVTASGFMQGDGYAQNNPEGYLDWVKVQAIAPDVTVTAHDATLSEAADPANPGTLRVHRDGAPTDVPLTVTLKTDGGTATAGDDYTPPATAQFAVGESFVDVPITAIDDAVWEPTETIILAADAAAPGAKYLAPATNPADRTLWLLDDDWKVTAAQVDFDTVRVGKDDGSSYLSVEWVDADGDGDATGEDEGENQSPVALGRSTSAYSRLLWLSPQFTVQGTLPAGQYVLTGESEATSFTPSLTWQKTFPYAGGNITPGAMVSQGGMGQLIDAATLSITWRLHAAAGVDRMQYTSRNPLYVAGKEPGQAVYHTVLDIGCKGAKGTRPEDKEDANGNGLLDPDEDVLENGRLDWQTLDGILGEFEDLSVRRTLDDAVMTYWGDHSGPTSPYQDLWDTAGLLANADGRCAAWRSFFIDVLRVQGLTAGPSDQLVDAVSVNAPDKSLDVVPATPAGCSREFWGLVMDVNEPAQGTPSPWRYFPDHALVWVDGIVGLYDPSYGREYQGMDSDQQWEDAAVSGFCYRYAFKDGSGRVVSVVVGSIYVPHVTGDDNVH